jgi:DNA-binding MarR family transcriptional regulator
MADEETIKLALELQRALQRGTMWTVLLHHTVAAKAGINVTDAQCANLLALDGPMTPGQLAQAMGITTGGAITAVIDRLEKAGYVKRTRDAEDRRRVIVELIPENVEKIAAYFEPIARSTMERYSALTPDELRFLLDFTRSNNDAMPGIIQTVQKMP